MKLIHLSDLHLGKRVNEISMLEEQKHILVQILQIIDYEQPEAVLIAGDVYDKSVPSTDAVSLFDEFLCKLAKKKVQVLIISGNHDSAERLAFANRLIRDSGIHISPVYDGTIAPIVLQDGEGEVYFWMMPFLKPIHVRQLHPDETIENYTDACRAVIEKMGADASKRNVLLAHQFVTGGTTRESEEHYVGGTENVDAAVFEGFDYVALGHLHGPQNIGSNRLRYCGTPLKYSFSEADDHKSVTVVELGQKGSLNLRLVPLLPLHDMKEIKGSFAELTSPEFTALLQTQRADALEDYYHIVLTDEEDIMGVAAKLRALYPNLMKISYDNTRTRSRQEIKAAEKIEQKTPMELFGELYRMQNNKDMNEEQFLFAQKLMEEIMEGKR